MICPVVERGRPIHSRGLCSMHSKRLSRHGSLLSPSRRRPLEARFWARVNRQGPIPEYAPHLGPCWLWTGCFSSSGYAKVGLGGNDSKPIYGHRLAYILAHGDIPDGLEIDHLCRIRACVRPEHLEPVTTRENQHRSPISLGGMNAAKTHCLHGHPFDEANTYWRPDNGHRVCRECSRARVRARRAA